MSKTVADVLMEYRERPYGRLSRAQVMELLGRIESALAAQGQAGTVPEHVRRLIGRIDMYRLCMSYNDSYFGEPAGLLKGVFAELAHAVNPIYPSGKTALFDTHAQPAAKVEAVRVDSDIADAISGLEEAYRFASTSPRAQEAINFAIDVMSRTAAPTPASVPDGYVVAPHFRGFAHLGLGRYRLFHSRAGAEAELSIVPAMPEEVAGRAVGDLRDDGPDEIPAELIAVRLRFENVAGLDALEQQLRLLRETHFPTPAHHPGAHAMNYQAVYDAVSANFANTGHMLDCVAHDFITTATEQRRPSVLYRPELTLDGSQWCALYGKNLMEGIAGFGDTPELAMVDFDNQFRTAKATEPNP